MTQHVPREDFALVLVPDTKTYRNLALQLFSDNYVALMPGERRSIRTEIEAADTRGEEPRIVVDGFNVAIRL